MKEVIYPLARFDLFSTALSNCLKANVFQKKKQRSLVSLARALVKNAKIIILDEATGKFTTDIILKYAHSLPPTLQRPWIMKQIEKSRIQLHTNSKIELFSVLHVSQTV